MEKLYEPRIILKDVKEQKEKVIESFELARIDLARRMIDALRQVKLEEKERMKPVEAVITDEEITLRVEWKEEPKTEETR